MHPTAKATGAPRKSLPTFPLAKKSKAKEYRGRRPVVPVTPCAVSSIVDHRRSADLHLVVDTSVSESFTLSLEIRRRFPWTSQGKRWIRRRCRLRGRAGSASPREITSYPLNTRFRPVVGDPQPDGPGAATGRLLRRDTPAARPVVGMSEQVSVALQRCGGMCAASLQRGHRCDAPHSSRPAGSTLPPSGRHKAGGGRRCEKTPVATPDRGGEIRAETTAKCRTRAGSIDSGR